MSDLESSSKETVLNTWTSQTWNGTKVLKQLIQGKPFSKACSLKLKQGTKSELKCLSFKYVKNFPT